MNSLVAMKQVGLALTWIFLRHLAVTLCELNLLNLPSRLEKYQRHVEGRVQVE